MGQTEHQTDAIGNTSTVWETLETWSVPLFLLGSAIELLFAAINGAVYLTAAFAYQPWMSLTVLVGRLAVLLGIAGLSVQVATRNPRFGRWSQVVVSLAVGFTSVLLVLAALQDFGVFATPVIALFGLGTVLLTVLTFALFGVAIIRTGAFSTLVGGLLVAASITLVALFVGLEILSLSTRLAGAVGEGVFFVLFVTLWHVLRSEAGSTDRSDAPLDAPVE